MLKQQTIESEVSINGIGLHNGKEVNVTFCPATENFGIKFQRTDLGDDAIIKADCDLVSSSERGTTLKKDEIEVATTEHVLAAISGLQIDNILIKIDNSELPILDGSAKPFVDLLKQAKVVVQEADKKYFELKEKIEYFNEAKNVQMVAYPSDKFELTVMIDFDSEVIGNQYATIKDISEFVPEIADARTFCFLHEIKPLLENNLIKGGSLENAVVIVEQLLQQDELKDLAVKFNKTDIEVNANGILNTTKLRYTNEPARHKLLDVLGDLALTGMPIKAKIFAKRPGHLTNVEFAKIIKQKIKESRRSVNVPFYDPSATPLIDTKEIMRRLPHKSPMLLVDKVIELTDTRVVGIKNVTYNEPFFPGHFPGNPIMPGVLIIEAMAQCGGILALNTVDDPQNYLTFFMRIDKARFKNPVVPGDTLIFEMELLQPIRRGICEMKATAFVGNKIATEAVLVASIVKRKDESN